jgi:hypothetical protein
MRKDLSCPEVKALGLIWGAFGQVSIWSFLVRHTGEGQQRAKREAAMERRNTYWGTVKRVAAVLIVGFAVAALFYKLDGEIGQGCGLLHAAGWLVLQVLRPLVVGGLASVQAYVPDNAGCLQDLPQMVASLASVVCGVAG